MSEITVNPNPAQNVHVDTTENFAEFATRIHDRRVQPLLFDNGEPIVLNPESQYCVISLEMKEILVPEKFPALFAKIYAAILEAENEGILEPGQVKDVATLFNLTPPEVPQRYIDEVPGCKIRIVWKGDQRFLIERLEPEVIV